MPLSRRALVAIAALVVLGVAARLWLAFATYGVEYDMDLWTRVAAALRVPGDPVYETGWLYPPGLLAVIAFADAVARTTGLPFHGAVQVPVIAADAALGVLVALVLRRRGFSDRHAVAGGALVLLGPSFLLISGYHGQFDALAILPAVLGVLVWIGARSRRALWAGALIGAGVAMKTVPGICALALLPTARNRREAAVLLGATLAVPAALVLPFLAIDGRGALEAMTSNRGVPGFGGISALVMPELTTWWAAPDGAPPVVTPLINDLVAAQNLLVGAAVLAVAVMLWRRRVAPLAGLVALWLTVLAVNPNFSFQYVVWLLPFLLLAGRLGTTLALQAVLVVPGVLLYFRPSLPGDGWAYWLTVQAGWALVVALWIAHLRAIAADGAQVSTTSPWRTVFSVTTRGSTKLSR